MKLWKSLYYLDGTSIYLTMAAIFIAQATQTTLTFGQELGILGNFLLTSKGAAAVTGGGFITLAATLKSTPINPVPHPPAHQAGTLQAHPHRCFADRNPPSAPGRTSSAA